MPPLRRLFRTCCALLALFGLATSGFEGLACNDIENASVLHGTNLIARAASESAPADAAAPLAVPCCPCIHSFPVALRVALIPTPPALGVVIGFPLTVQPPPDRHPEPLVPPPIA